MSKSESGTELGFADTNVWLYALLATQDAGKSLQAQAIIRDRPLIISAQVVNEVSVNLIRKAGFIESQIQELIASFYERHTVVPLDRDTLLQASQLRGRYQFSFWDSLMVASALAGNARVLYSEDMQDGMVLENRLRIANPFRPTVGAVSGPGT